MKRSTRNQMKAKVRMARILVGLTFAAVIALIVAIII